VDVSEILARFIAGSRWDDIPAPIRREARRGILNAAGCILAGRREPEIATLANVFPQDDALLDAAAATALDYDDTHLRTVIHATPPVVGVLFSLARKTPVSGPELLHAYVVGVETTCRLGNAVMPGHYERGWHITSTCGIFGAAAAASSLLKLNASKARNALAHAATQAAGLVEVLGSQARVLNAGFAARNGLDATLLAAEGLEGPLRPLEGLRGFFNVFGGAQDFPQITSDLGKRWEMTNVAYKPYPCGVVLHALIDLCIECRKEISSSEAITVSLHPLAIERTNRPAPKNALEARLSAQHAVAVSLLRGAAGPAMFSDTVVNDPQIAAFRRRVSIVRDESLDKMAAIITDGKTTLRADAPKPMDDARLEAKFRGQAGKGAEKWLRFVESLESTKVVEVPGSR